MHAITGDRAAVLELMADTRDHLAAEPKPRPAARASSTRTAATRTSQRQAWAKELDEAIQRESGAGGRLRASGLADSVPQDWYAPRDAVVALFQAAMDEYLTERVGPAPSDDPSEAPVPQRKKKRTAKKVSKKRTARAASAARSGAEDAEVASLQAFYQPRPSARAGALDLAPKFSHLDPGWATVVLEKAKLLFKGKHKFIQHRSTSDFGFTMANQARIAIVGDWGGGNAAARAVAAQITRLKPDHVIHLGDVYYAGTPREVEDRFLKYWRYWSSAAKPGRSLALNSNHEMYSGGHGYFDLTLKAFKQPASYFRLENEHWRFIGLDTGYEDHDLNAKQREWLHAQFKGSFPKTILLSHHQLFSAFEPTDSSKLKKAVAPLLDRQAIYGWIWGHEHLCVVYEPHLGVNAICLGNGCFPYNAPKAKPKVPVKWLDRRTQKDPHYSGTHTFALLTLDGPKIDFQFIDQHGDVASPITWR